jgi:hypothetical protein
MATTKVSFQDTLNISQLRTLIPIVGKDLTVVVQSEPGCGKSSLLAMMAADNGDKWRSPKDGTSIEGDKYDYIYVDCPVKDMSDIGMTIPNHATRQLEYYVSELFNLNDPKPKYIMLDEFMKSPKLLQVIFTRLMLEHMAGDRALPSGSVLCATSNNSSDGVGDTMLAHAGNRVCIVRMAKPTASEWLLWATENGISRAIRSCVAMFPRFLSSYTTGDQDDNPYIFKPSSPNLSFVTPRSLAKADVIVRNRDALGEHATMVALSGTIGIAAAKDMSAFLSLERSLVDFKEIVKDPEGVAVPDAVSAQLMLMFQAIDSFESQDEVSSFMKFVERIPSSEIQSVFFTMMMRGQRTVRFARKNLAITQWAQDNHELF